MIDYGRRDLRGSDWTLLGWRRNDWELGRTPAATKVAYPDVAPVAARVPGSVAGALLDAEVVTDPTVGLRSRDAEWIEHRDWEFRRTLDDGVISAEDAAAGRRLLLECDELDFAGAVLLGQCDTGRFRGSFTPYVFDLTDAYLAGERMLRIVLTGAPDGLGQNGWSTAIRDFKPRFSYGWDWTPRMVSVGIPGAVRLCVRERAGSTLTALIHGDHDPESGASSLEARVEVEGTAPHGSILQLTLDGRVVASGPPSTGMLRVEIDAEPWQLAGRGRQTLHHAAVRLTSADGSVLDQVERRVGFRSVVWAMTESAPAGADPWLCVVNGEPVFLSGVNWVPIRPNYADVTEADYRLRLERYRDIGVVMLRVWGGSGIERPVFYDLCDELGLLVWQEFPLCSSGLDNEPPSDPEFIAELVEVAESYVRRIIHHACLVLWSGGNELNTVPEPGVPGPPLTAAHPTLAALAEVTARLDPWHRFTATSPSGPRFEADAAEYGLGLHHDVHGPWETPGDAADWRTYWDADDAVMRSEVGVAGASGMDLLRRHGLTAVESPEELRQLWTHTSGWWLGPLDAWIDEGADLAELPAWVDRSQARQADLLGYAARQSRDRFPACAGFLVWLGHDTFPCAVSLSLLDADGGLKPAAETFRDIFASPSPTHEETS